MADSRPFSPDRVPTLTDVLHVSDSSLAMPISDTVANAPVNTVADIPGNTVADNSALAVALLASIQGRIDPMFQARLREAIAPALARAVDSLLREIGPELASVLRDTAECAVAQELDRRRRMP